MINKYYEIAISEIGIKPKDFWDMTCKDIDYMYLYKEQDFKEKYELASWQISYLTAPHVKKMLKPKELFNWEEIKAKSLLTPEDEAEAFEKMFMTTEEKQALRKENITKRLIELNKKKALENGSKNIKR